ncbi:glycosyltransferase [Candidatus Saccharibacteria bacterium]|nr:glycosyltransferase [Candidatus Saccharibacteria bacterium]
MSLTSLIGKVRRTLADEGVVSVAKKTKNYLVFKAQTGFKTDEMRDILFINGCTLSHPERYRVDHQMEQLEACGLSVEKVLYTNLDVEKLKYYRAVVIFRCPITEEVQKLIEKAHYYNKRVFYDVDDLVIDTKYTDKIDHVQKMNKEERALYDDGVKRMGETMKLCDYCITTTPALKRELEKYGKEVYVNKNVASEKMVKLSLDAIKNVKKDSNEVVIGYLSGSITHNPDLELITPALVQILEEFPQAKLCVMGYLNLPKDLERFEDRVIRKPFGSWEELPKVIAGLDINLAPIEKTVFNEAKSENKWTEAALCKVVTVASDFGAFKDAIDDGETGMLCKTSNEWYEKIKRLVLDKKLREQIGENAHKKAIKNYVTTYTGRGLAEFISSKLAKNIAFVLPSTNISGGVNVVFKHCEILRSNGWDVMAINMDKSDKNVVSEDGEVNVVSGVKHDVNARFDRMVATLYTTLKYVKEYPNAGEKMYLVQNFETDFNEYGSPVKREANATYHENGIKYLTISEWCKEWLEKDFGRKVKYAPNGIDLDKFKYRERDLKGKIKILVEGNSKDYYKNVDESFRIVERLDQEKFEIVYLSYLGKPKAWYRVDKFYNRVPHDEVGKIYEECDILLKTSILESFSYPPLEMMATGGYVVAVPNGGNQEYLKDGENCLFYEQGDIDGGIKKIEKIVEDEELRNKLTKNGRKVAESRDWKKIEDKIVGLYK